MCEELKKRIDEEYLPQPVKDWWYSLTENQKRFWIHRAKEEQKRVADGTANSNSLS